MPQPAFKVAAAPAPFMLLPTVKAIFDAMTEAFKLAARESQFLLAEYVRSTVASGGVCAIEAPTGTGKTLGYLAGALEAQAHAAKPIPVVVATATVGLQAQILRHDIPRLAAVGAVDPRKVAVAKGRGRYFCPRTAALLEDKKMDHQTDMFAPEKQVSDGGTVIALDMLRAWRNKEWNGDRDDWEGALPSCWDSACGASSDTCVNRACDHFDVCPYMASRAKLATAQLIIANHDMVLADLAQRAEEQTNTALPPKSYVVIFDEAHNLSEKAIATRRATARLHDTDWLRQLEAYGDRAYSTPKIAKALERVEASPAVFSAGAAHLLHGMEALSQLLRQVCQFDASGNSSWSLKMPPDMLRQEVLELAARAQELEDGLHATAKAYTDLAEQATGAEKGFAVRQLAETHKFARMVGDLSKGLRMFCEEDAELVRWATRRRDGDGLELHTQPMEGSGVLTKLLWNSGFTVAMVSATLQIAGNFERFRAKTGLPKHAVTAALPAVFDYSRGLLHLPIMGSAPNEPGFEAELVDKLPKLFNCNDGKGVSPGMLVLFTSRESMRKVVRGLPESMAQHVLMQDHRPLPELIQQHRENIDAGRRSVLVGLDSMNEGLDLPGKYLGHVVITRLPFAVPGDPVEEARREFLGKRWFEEAYLADMLIALIQGTGRLIRREDDHGVITVLDKRLQTKRYAALALSALPGFTRGVRLAEYFKLAEQRGFDLSHGQKKPESAKKLELVHSAAEPLRPSAGKQAGKLAAVAAPVIAAQPLDTVWNLVDQLPPSGRARRCELDDLPQALQSVLPVAPGPFSEDDYLLGTETPCLAPTTAALVWAERQMPQAVMLGLRLCNQPWYDSVPAWQQVLSLRPDLLQFAQVLRSHRQGLLDERNSVLPAQVCEQQLLRGVSGLGYSGDEDLFQFLERVEGQTCAIIRKPFRVPSKDLLLEMVQAAQSLARDLRLRRT